MFFISVDENLAQIMKTMNSIEIYQFREEELDTMSNIRLQIREEIRKTTLAKDHRSSEIQFKEKTTNNFINRKRKWMEAFDENSEIIKKMSENDYNSFFNLCQNMLKQF